MSQTTEALYYVSLKHLARDGKTAAVDFPPVDLVNIPEKQLRGLLDGMGSLGPNVVYPVEPELRITAPDGRFVVQLKGGKLHLVSWSARHTGGQYSAEQIFAIITGREVVETASSGGGGRRGGSWLRGNAMVVLLVLGILAVNSFTIWFVSRPKRTLTPKYTEMASDSSERLLENVAGVYETGAAPGDRRLEIDKTGKVHRYRLSADRKPTAPQLFDAKGVNAGGKPALLIAVAANKKTVITVIDPLTVMLYGDRYRRVVK